MTKENKRKAAHLLKNMHIPENANKQAYGKNLLHNIINQQVEEDLTREMDDVLRLNKPNQNAPYQSERISQEYDLGNWQ